MTKRIERKTDCVIKKYAREDREKVWLFFKKNLWQSKQEIEAIFRWKYEENPQGTTLGFTGMNSQNEVVAQSMFMPWKLSLQKKEIKAYQWVDMFIELPYRGLSLPTEMIRGAWQDFKTTNADLCFAFPNQNGIMVHKKNSGIHLGCILRYTKPLDTAYLIKRIIRNTILAKIFSFFSNIVLILFSRDTFTITLGNIFEKIDNCGQKFDDFWKQFSQIMSNKIMISKDSSYLNWKYTKSPNPNRKLFALNKKGIVVGFVVLESIQNIGYVVDIAAIDKKTVNKLISLSIKYFRKQKKNSVVFATLEDNVYLPAFERFGFIRRPEEKHFYIYIDENKVNREFFINPKNWFITIGDCEIEGI